MRRISEDSATAVIECGQQSLMCQYLMCLLPVYHVPSTLKVMDEIQQGPA